MISTFNHIVAADCGNISYGVLVSKTSSQIEIFGGAKSVFSVDSKLSSIFPLENHKMGFYDYISNEIGVVDVELGAISWRSSVAGKNQLDYVGCVSDMQWMVVQEKGVVSILSAVSGDIIEHRMASGIVCGLGGDWNLEAYNKSLIFKSGCTEAAFSRKEPISFVEQFGNFVVFIEYQGPIRIVDTSRSVLVFEATPDAGSQFSKAFVKDGGVFYTQHFFDCPEMTIIHKYEEFYNIDHSTTKIPCSGRYVFARGGSELAFTNRKIFSSLDGHYLRSF